MEYQFSRNKTHRKHADSQDQQIRHPGDQGREDTVQARQMCMLDYTVQREEAFLSNTFLMQQ